MISRIAGLTLISIWTALSAAAGVRKAPYIDENYPIQEVMEARFTDKPNYQIKRIEDGLLNVSGKNPLPGGKTGYFGMGLTSIAVTTGLHDFHITLDRTGDLGLLTSSSEKIFFHPDIRVRKKIHLALQSPTRVIHFDKSDGVRQAFKLLAFDLDVSEKQHQRFVWILVIENGTCIPLGAADHDFSPWVFNGKVTLPVEFTDIPKMRLQADETWKSIEAYSAWRIRRADFGSARSSGSIRLDYAVNLMTRDENFASYIDRVYFKKNKEAISPDVQALSVARPKTRISDGNYRGTYLEKLVQRMNLGTYLSMADPNMEGLPSVEVDLTQANGSMIASLVESDYLSRTLQINRRPVLIYDQAYTGSDAFLDDFLVLKTMNRKESFYLLVQSQGSKTAKLHFFDVNQTHYLESAMKNIPPCNDRLHSNRESQTPPKLPPTPRPPLSE